MLFSKVSKIFVKNFKFIQDIRDYDKNLTITNLLNIFFNTLKYKTLLLLL